MSTLYGGLRKTDQTSIALESEIASFTAMESWVRALNLTRNICAHHNRLWNRPIVVHNAVPLRIVARLSIFKSGITSLESKNSPISARQLTLPSASLANPPKAYPVSACRRVAGASFFGDKSPPARASEVHQRNLEFTQASSKLCVAHVLNIRKQI